MTPEQMTNEELASEFEKFSKYKDYLVTGGKQNGCSQVMLFDGIDAEVWFTEAARRLRNSIPKPVVEVKPSPIVGWQVRMNNQCIHATDKEYKAEDYALGLRQALGMKGGGDER